MYFFTMYNNRTSLDVSPFLLLQFIVDLKSFKLIFNTNSVVINPGFGDMTPFNGDVIFLMDSSSPVTSREFLHEKYIIKTISRYMNIYPNKSRSAIISYGQDPELLTNFTGYRTFTDYQSLVDNAVVKSGVRRIDRALELAIDIGLQVRHNYPKVLILITAGKHSADLEYYRKKLTELGIRSYAIVISPKPVENSVLPLVERPDDVFKVNSFELLQPAARPIAWKIYRGLGKLSFYQAIR